MAKIQDLGFGHTFFRFERSQVPNQLPSAPSFSLRRRVPACRATLAKHFRWKIVSGIMKAWTRVVLLLGHLPRQMGRDQMGTILAIMAVPALTATGIYNPQVMQHGRCIAEPGSFDALYCSAPAEPPRHRHAKK